MTNTMMIMMSVVVSMAISSLCFVERLCQFRILPLTSDVINTSGKSPVLAGDK
jgi:hypothetical protein